MAKDLLKTIYPYDGSCITSWKQLTDLFEDRRFGFRSHGWIFRGVNTESCRLQTGLEKTVVGFSPNKTPKLAEARLILSGQFGERKRTVYDIEGGLMRAFRRRCHHYVERPPVTPLEVLALMQHYEAPTRLQDWTYSFYVALFFAVDRASGESCSVWAADSQWIAKRFEIRYPTLWISVDSDRNLQINPETFRRVFRGEILLICPVNPYFLNQRLAIQQGIFLCPGAVCVPFEDNLAELQYEPNGDVAADAASKLYRIRISAAPSTRNDILQHLRQMDVSRATLFPGIEGFSRSLENYLAYPDILEYGDKYEADFQI